MDLEASKVLKFCVDLTGDDQGYYKHGFVWKKPFVSCGQGRHLSKLGIKKLSSNE